MLSHNLLSYVSENANTVTERIYITHLRKHFPWDLFFGNELFLKLSYISNVAITHVTAV